MDEMKAEIQQWSTQAAQLSQQARLALAGRNFAVGKDLMRQAMEASRNCQSLIEQYHQIEAVESKG